MQTDTISATVAALIAMAGEAQRLAAKLQRSRFTIDHRTGAIFHRISLVANELGLAIVQAEAALSPSARSAMSEPAVQT